MENLVFSLNATIPVFLMMILGFIFHKIGWLDDVSIHCDPFGGGHGSEFWLGCRCVFFGESGIVLKPSYLLVGWCCVEGACRWCGGVAVGDCIVIHCRGEPC